MCMITATEFKENFSKYLNLATKEEILVTKNGKPLIRLCSAKASSWNDFFEEFGGKFTLDKEDLEDPRIAHMLGE